MTHKRLLILLLIPLLSSCVYFRLLRLKYQLDSFEDNFTLLVHKDKGYTLNFKSPLLYDEDILFITFAPDKKTTKDKIQTWHYLFEKVNTPDTGSMPVRLEFNDDKRLSKIHFPFRFSVLIPPKQFLDIAHGIGDGKVNRSSRQIIAKAKQRPETIVLTRAQIDKQLGKPLSVSKEKNGIAYFYRYKLRKGNGTVWARVHFNQYNQVIKMQSHLAGGRITVLFTPPAAAKNNNTKAPAIAPKQIKK